MSEPWSNSVHRVWRDETADKMEKGYSEMSQEPSEGKVLSMVAQQAKNQRRGPEHQEAGGQY